MTGPQAALLPDGRRLHLNHGPIDLVIEAWGEVEEVRAAYRQAAAAFPAVLPALVGELAVLRRPLAEAPLPLEGPVARRMQAACWPYRRCWITPMAAVAGAVADHILAALRAGGRLRKAYVNDGGDIAFHLEAGENLTCGVVADVAAPGLDGSIALTHDMAARGIATSGAATKGRGGRSFSLGIADAVTVLARDAAAADAAATMIANAVDLPGHPAIRRLAANDLDPDSDLGDCLVTHTVGELAQPEIAAALRAGATVAGRDHDAGLLHGAVLALRGQYVVVGDIGMPTEPLKRLWRSKRALAGLAR